MVDLISPGDLEELALDVGQRVRPFIGEPDKVPLLQKAGYTG